MYGHRAKSLISRGDLFAV